MTPEEIEARFLALERDNKKLNKDNKAFIKLINDHAGYINKNATTMKGIDKYIRTELQRVAASIRKLANRKVR